jgi:hypothetical protein
LDNGIEVKATVKAGVLDMNPAVVSVYVTRASEGTNVTVRGTAKEGLIKQNTSEEAVKRIAAAIKEYLDSRPASLKNSG